MISYQLTLDPTQNATLFVNAEEAAGSLVQVQLNANGNELVRLYVVEEEQFYLDPVPYWIGDLPDGSIAIPIGSAENFETMIEFPIRQLNTDYYLWATSGKGDHRNSNKNAVTGLGTITITGNDDTGYIPLLGECKSYHTELQAQSADGSSVNFVSTHGYRRAISESEAFSNYWDIGYHYDSIDGISLYSGFAYPKDAINKLKQIEPSDLNETYFTLRSDLNQDDFYAIRDIELYRWEEQDSYAFTTTSTSKQSVTDLQVNDVVEFLDSYGRRGFLQIQRETGSIDPDPTVRIPVQLLVFRRSL